MSVKTGSIALQQSIGRSPNWTRDQLKLAFHLYCQLPFGRLHQSNPEIMALAKLIGRTPSAVAMKLVNFASLDPAITGSGRVGLSGASKLDREIWAEFHADWEAMEEECEQLRARFGVVDEPQASVAPIDIPEDFVGETRQALVQQRKKQSFFRKAVLASYRGRCCMSGVSDARLLVASHIVPWSADKANRLNPSNGLCLSALHDRAFDGGLITLSDDLTVICSEGLLKTPDEFLQRTLLALADKPIEMPERFIPSNEFLKYHRNQIFLDGESSATSRRGSPERA